MRVAYSDLSARIDTLLDAVIGYASGGFEVVALYGVSEGRCDCGRSSCASAGKHPIATEFPNGHKSATADTERLRQVWRRYPNANIGLVPPQGVFIIDIDGEEGEDSLARFDLPDTATVRTSRGHHLYFRADPDQKPPRLKGVDFRFSGNGYVVAPPSRHVSGTRYRWLSRNADLAALPKHFTDGRRISVDFSGVARSVEEGGRNNGLTSIAGKLRAGGLTREELTIALDAFNSAICRPPLALAEVRQIARSVAQYPTPSESAFGEMADVQLEDVRWLYGPYIPRGTLTIVEGNPGDGKSNFTVAVAASVTTGAALPWAGSTAVGHVLFLSAEDDPARVLKPRLEANGADHSRIRFMKELFSLDEKGVLLLRTELAAHRVDLVIIDPIVAFLGSGDDLHKAADMTRFLTQLDLIAREFDCAMVLVRHLRKSGDANAINRGLGSIALAGRVRSMLMLGRHPTNDGQRALVHVKSNYAKEGPAILFSLPDLPSGLPAVRWEGVDPNLTDSDLVPKERAPGRPANELQAAVSFLRSYLQGGPKLSDTVKTAAETRNISPMTLRRASDELKIKKVRLAGGKMGWELLLAAEDGDTDEE